MTKHRHAEMIKAKADNMELVVLLNKYGKWQACHETSLPIYSDCEYFLCLPQHNENGQCLHWLNGGYVIVRDYPEDERERVLPVSGRPNWHDASVFMCERAGIRIKPKKEKRWIGVHKSGATTDTFLIKKEVEHAPFVEQSPGNWQFIEIEIEV